MQKSYIIAVFLMLGLFVPSCTKEEAVSTMEQSGANSGDTVFVPDTAVYSPSKYILSLGASIHHVKVSVDVTGEDGIVAFEDGDYVLLANDDCKTSHHAAKYRYSSDDDKFHPATEDDILSISKQGVLYAYYPADMYDRDSYAQNGEDGYIKMNACAGGNPLGTSGRYDGANNAFPMAGSLEDYDPVNNNVISFRNLDGVYILALKGNETVHAITVSNSSADFAGAAAVKFTSGTPGIDHTGITGSKEYTLSLAEDVTLDPTNATSFIFTLAPGSEYSDLNFRVVFTKGTKLYHPWIDVKYNKDIAIERSGRRRLTTTVGFFPAGDGVNTPYEISQAKDLQKLSELTNKTTEEDPLKDFEAFRMIKYKQTADITLSGNFTPICLGGTGAFAGTYDGGGKSISGLSINSETDKVGLFSRVTGAGTLKNLSLVSPTVTTSGTIVGVLVGACAKFSITDCSVTGGQVSSSFTGDAYVGGLVGKIEDNNKDVLENCSFQGTVSTPNGNYVGGLVSVFSSTNASSAISGCRLLSGSTVTGVDYVGGICGKLIGVVSNTSVAGTVKGEDNIGGIAGLYNRGSLSGCAVSCALTGILNIGGIVGQIQTLTSGKAATADHCMVYGGSLTTTKTASNTIGGFAGLIDAKTADVTIMNCGVDGSSITCTRTGTGNAQEGGFVGSITNTAAGSTDQSRANSHNLSILNSYAAPSAVAAANLKSIGGFLGIIGKRDSEFHVTNCHSFITTVAGKTAPTGDTSQIGRFLGTDSIAKSALDKGSDDRLFHCYSVQDGGGLCFANGLQTYYVPGTDGKYERTSAVYKSTEETGLCATLNSQRTDTSTWEEWEIVNGNYPTLKNMPADPAE